MRGHLALALLALLAFALGDLAPAEHGAQEPRFTFVDVFVDSGAEPLDAWQVRLSDPSGRANIVGIEGGEDPVYAAAPHHDPRVLTRILTHAEIVLAAFHTGGGAPAGRTRVARLHLAVEGVAPPAFEITLEVAAADGVPIAGARAEVSH